MSVARQSEGTFVLVLSSAFHFGFNQVRLCSEAQGQGEGEAQG